MFMKSLPAEDYSIAVDRGRPSNAIKAWIRWSGLLLVGAWVGVYFDHAGIVPHIVMLAWPLWLGIWMVMFCALRYPIERGRDTLAQMEITSLAPEGLARSFMRRPVKVGMILLAAAAPLYMLPHHHDFFGIVADPVSYSFTASLIMRPVMVGVSIFGAAQKSSVLISRCGVFESICIGGVSLLMDGFRLYAVAVVATSASVRSRNVATALLRMVVRIFALLIAISILEVAIGINLVMFVCGILPDWLGAVVTVIALVGIAGWLHSYWRQRQMLVRVVNEASGLPAIDGMAAGLFKGRRVFWFVGCSLGLFVVVPLALFLISLFTYYEGVYAPDDPGHNWWLLLVVMLTALIFSLECCWLNIRNRKRVFFTNLLSSFKFVRNWGPKLKLRTILLITVPLLAVTGVYFNLPLSWGFADETEKIMIAVSAIIIGVNILVGFVVALLLFRLWVSAWCRETQRVAGEGACWALKRARKWYASTLFMGLLLAMSLVYAISHLGALDAITGSSYGILGPSVRDRQLLLRMPFCLQGQTESWVLKKQFALAENPDSQYQVLIKRLVRKDLDILSPLLLQSVFSNKPWGSPKLAAEFILTAMEHPTPQIRNAGVFYAKHHMNHDLRLLPRLIKMAKDDPSEWVKDYAIHRLVSSDLLTKEVALSLSLMKLGSSNGSWAQNLALRPFGKQVVSDLISELDGKHGQKALFLLSEMGPLAREAVPALVARLDASLKYNRELAISGLAMIGPAAISALPMLRKIRQNGTSQERARAGYAIWRITGDATGVGIPLLKASRYDLLQNMGTAANEVQPGLLKQLAAGRCSGEVVAALGRTPIDPVPQLIKVLLKSTNSEVLYEVARALSDINPPPAEAVKALVSALPKCERYRYISELAYKALIRIGPPDSSTVKALEKELSGPNNYPLKSCNLAVGFFLFLARGERVSPQTATLLRKMMSYKDSYGGIGAAVACLQLNIDRKIALQSLIKRISNIRPVDNSRRYVEVELDQVVVDALGRTGVDALLAVPSLKKILEEKRYLAYWSRWHFLRIRAGVALWRITGARDATVNFFRRKLAQPYMWNQGFFRRGQRGSSLLIAIGEMGADAESLIPDIERQMNMAFPDLVLNRQARKTIAKIKAAVKLQKTK
jgi:hypothetical protein